MCFEEPIEVLETCLSVGGTPEAIIDEFNCPTTKCVLPGETKEIFLEKECLAQEQVDLYVLECENNGLKAVLETGIDGCIVPSCAGNQETLTESCKEYVPEEISGLEASCATQLGVLDYRFNGNGCKEPVCVTLNENLCYQVPENAKKLCAADGGEMVEVKDQAGCVTYSYCLGKTSDDFKFEPIKQLPSKEEIDATVSELSELEAAIEVVAEKLGALKSFYESSQDTTGSQRVEVAKAILEDAASSLREMREFLFQHSGNVTIEQLSEIRAKLGSISHSLEKALGVLLGAYGGTQEENNCGSNMDCFQGNLSTCTPSTATLFDSGVTFNVSVNGIENGNCVMNVQAIVNEQDLSMTCRYASYANGALGGKDTQAFLDSCEGTLLEYMFSKVD